MKKIAFLLLTISVLSCSSTASTPSLTQAKQAIDKQLDRWHKAASDADFATYFSIMDTNSIFVGTDAKEVWNKKEFMDFSKPYFDKGKAWSFRKIKRNIYYTTGEKYSYFDETLDTWMGVCRGSGVLRLRDGQWYIQHYILSVTVPNEKMKAFIDLLKK